LDYDSYSLLYPNDFVQVIASRIRQESLHTVLRLRNILLQGSGIPHKQRRWERSVSQEELQSSHEMFIKSSPQRVIARLGAITVVVSDIMALCVQITNFIVMVSWSLRQVLAQVHTTLVVTRSVLYFLHIKLSGCCSLCLRMNFVTIKLLCALRNANQQHSDNFVSCLPVWLYLRLVL